MAVPFYGGQRPHVHLCEPPVAGLRAPGVIFCGRALATAALTHPAVLTSPPLAASPAFISFIIWTLLP